MRKKKLPKNPTTEDLPTNAEFKRFAASAHAIVEVPKAEIDRLLAEERELKAQLATDLQVIEERLAGSTAIEPD
jgi:hypothetical protein